MNNEPTPTALAGNLMEDAQTLLDATSNIAEEKVAGARKRLATAVQNGREILGKVQDQALAGTKAADQTIRAHPYQAIGVALGVGALLGFLFGRRD